MCACVRGMCACVRCFETKVSQPSCDWSEMTGVPQLELGDDCCQHHLHGMVLLCIYYFLTPQSIDLAFTPVNRLPGRLHKSLQGFELHPCVSV